jgi:hypothetical protein
MATRRLSSSGWARRNERVGMASFKNLRAVISNDRRFGFVSGREKSI